MKTAVIRKKTKITEQAAGGVGSSGGCSVADAASAKMPASNGRSRSSSTGFAPDTINCLFLHSLRKSGTRQSAKAERGPQDAAPVAETAELFAVAMASSTTPVIDDEDVDCGATTPPARTQTVSVVESC
jgi:hypothetical protein